MRSSTSDLTVMILPRFSTLKDHNWAKIKNSEARWVPMNMMSKCAKFHKHSQSDKKAKFNLLSAIELSERVDFVYNFVWKPSKRATLVAQLTNFSFEFSNEIFTEDASLLLLYQSAKSQNDQLAEIKGSCLN